MGYIAPELLWSSRSKPRSGAPGGSTMCGPPVACWALGVTALELLTGCCLFNCAHDQPTDILTDECEAWAWRYTADLHEEWVRPLSGSPFFGLEKGLFNTSTRKSNSSSGVFSYPITLAVVVRCPRV